MTEHEPLVKIATGGTATVYVGRRRGQRTLVAIKRMHPYLADGARDQMRREARLAGGVIHDNLVRIHGVEGEGESLHLIMDYVEGGSLAELLSKGALPLAVALSILRDGLAGLSALHAITDDEGRLRFVHRDVSPQNIFVGRDGVAKLGDFGLLTRGDATHSHTSSIRGKLAYMAPEQMEGQRAAQSVDTYAFGVVMWETLSGRRLFRGANDADTIRRVMVGDAPSLSTLLPDCPSALDALVMRCLRRHPAARFPDAAALQRAFDEAVADLPIASAEETGALVEARLGGVLARRRATLAAAMDAEITATGEVDVDALVADRGWQDPPAPDEATMVEGTLDLPTMVDHVRGEPTEQLDPTELQRWSRLQSSAPPPPVSSPPASAPVTTSSLAATPAPARSRWTVPLVAVTAAATGAGLAWWAARAPAATSPSAADPAASSRPAAPSRSASSEPASGEPNPPASSAALQPEPMPSDSPPAQEAGAPPSRPASPPRPIPRRPPPAKPQPPDTVVVPDNPYR